MQTYFSNFLKVVGIALVCFNAIHASGIQDCRLKYTGNLIIEDQPDAQIGIAGSGNQLGQTDYTIHDGSAFEPVNFEFFECKIDGYYHYPDEFGFLIAEPVSTTYCTTAYDVDGYKPKKSALNHHTCNYDASNKTLINRQLVYANYIRPQGSDGQVQITFQGSPNNETRTGFDSRHAYFNPYGRNYTENNAVIISNDATSPKLTLVDVQIAAHESMEQGMRTTNEQAIVNAVNAGQKVKFTPSVANFLSSSRTLF